MILRQLVALSLVSVVLLAGCVSSSRPKTIPPTAKAAPAKPFDLATASTAPAPTAPEPELPIVEPVSHKKPEAWRGKAPGPVTPALKQGEYALMVESDPEGATVVVNGKPCGKTPCRVVLQANRRGFLREQVSIKVRFIAANESQSSQTVEDVLTTFDKVPAEIRFTAAGATRVVR